MAGRAMPLLFALLPAAVYAFSDTHPVVAFASSPQTFPSPNSITNAPDTPAVLDSILSSNSVCAHDAVILVDQIGLHASDLRTLSPESSLASALKRDPQSIQIPYTRRSAEHPFADLSATLARRCDAGVISFDPSAPFHSPSEKDGAEKGKYIVHVSMPSLEGLRGTERKKAMAVHDENLFLTLSRLSLNFDNYVVVYAGWLPSRLSARQLASNSSTAHAFAAPEGGILARYQLLTPGLILALIVGFFVLVPIILFGISALASIQSPLKTEPPKGFVAADKKNQ